MLNNYLCYDMFMNVDDFEAGKCNTCPRVTHCIDDAYEVKQHARHIASDAMSQELDDHFAPALFEVLRDTAGDLPIAPLLDTINSPQELAKGIRKGAGMIVEELDAKAQESLDEASGLVSGCEGPLKMKATKAGRQIIVTVCNSPSISDSTDCDPAHVTRTTLS